MRVKEDFFARGYSEADYNWFIDYTTDYVNFMTGQDRSVAKDTLVSGAERWRAMYEKLELSKGIFDPILLAVKREETYDYIATRDAARAKICDSGGALPPALTKMTFYDYYGPYIKENIPLPEILDKPFDISQIAPETFQKVTRQMVEKEVSCSIPRSKDSVIERFDDMKHALQIKIWDVMRPLEAREQGLNLVNMLQDTAYSAARESLPADVDRRILDAHVKEYYKGKTHQPDYRPGKDHHIARLLNALADTCGGQIDRNTVRLELNDALDSVASLYRQR